MAMEKTQVMVSQVTIVTAPAQAILHMVSQVTIAMVMMVAVKILATATLATIATAHARVILHTATLDIIAMVTTTLILIQNQPAKNHAMAIKPAQEILVELEWALILLIQTMKNRQTVVAEIRNPIMRSFLRIQTGRLWCSPKRRQLQMGNH